MPDVESSYTGTSPWVKGDSDLIVAGCAAPIFDAAEEVFDFVSQPIEKRLGP